MFSVFGGARGRVEGATGELVVSFAGGWAEGATGELLVGFMVGSGRSYGTGRSIRREGC